MNLGYDFASAMILLTACLIDFRDREEGRDTVLLYYLLMHSLVLLFFNSFFFFSLFTFFSLVVSCMCPPDQG